MISLTRDVRGFVSSYTYAHESVLTDADGNRMLQVSYFIKSIN